MRREAKTKLLGILVGAIIGVLGAAYALYISAEQIGDGWESARRFLVSFGFPASLIHMALEYAGVFGAGVAGEIGAAQVTMAMLFLVNAIALGYFFTRVEQSLLWKFVLILAIVVLAILNVEPPRERLKAGIDLAGGSSLIYRIDTSGLEAFEERTIAQDMIRILQERVDPGNKRNLVWRPHGNDQIEIQMPLATKQTRTLRQVYLDRADELAAYNLDLNRVRELLIPPADKSVQAYQAGREAEFKEIAGDSAERLEGLMALAQAEDALRAGAARNEAALEAKQLAEDGLTAAGLSATAVERLYRDWDQLDEPNRVGRVEALSQPRTQPESDKAEDQKKVLEANAELIRKYIAARQELGQARSLFGGDASVEVVAEQAWAEVEGLNVDMDRLREVLAGSGKRRQEEIDKLKDKFPQRAEAIDAVEDAYDRFNEVSGRLDDPEDLKRLLRGSGVLEFRIMPGQNSKAISESQIQRYMDRLEKHGPTRAGDDQYLWVPIRTPQDFAPGLIRAEFAGTEYVLSSNQENEVMLRDKGGLEWRLTNARPTSDQLGMPAIGFSFNEIGASLFWNLTKNNSQRSLGILLDGEALSAPNIDEPILRSGIIKGRFTSAEVMDMVDKLRAGSLPARLSAEPISENTIGPMIGADNLAGGLRAGIVGLLVVAVFMFIYYLLAGSLADVALFFNLLIIMGIMALMRGTFTMPGIAGLILTIGMAVDANVLVFERIREEQQRGASLRMAIKNGYGRAFRTIMDANVTTFVTALILWMVASEEVKGFALILMIGIITSMFTALFVTRTVFDFLTERRLLTERLKMMQAVKKPNANWMSARPIFWIVSACLVVGGWTVFSSVADKYSIEFTGGTSIRIVVNEDMDRADVEQKIRDEGANLPQTQLAFTRVQSVGTADQRQFEIVTTETNRVTVPIQVLAGQAITADEVLEQVHKVARQRGDRRLEQATVQAGEKPEAFLLQTSQTNANVVRDILDRTVRQLAQVTYSLSDTDEGLCQVAMKGAAGLTQEAVRQAIIGTQIDLRDTILGEDAVIQAESDGFTFVSEQAEDVRVKRVLDQAILRLAPITYGQIQVDDIVNQAVTTALEGKLDVLEDLEPGEASAEPITAELLAQKPYLQQYEGGLLVTGSMGKGETLVRLQSRFEESRFRSGFERYGDYPFVLFAPENAEQDDSGVLQAVEMAVRSGDMLHQYTPAEEWQEFSLKQTERFKETLSWKTSLPRVTQVDPSVGEKSMNDALVAIVLSLAAIIAYIWARFGTPRFGMAAVAALIHDVSIAMGMVAASGWLAETALGRALLIDKFEIDLPMIAAFLTVIGYSLNDTIVIFDRIRENRGKLATLSPSIINASINQTLSRTILTSATTLLVLIVMYIWGGPGLRGFNYVMIIGVLVGTYSSVGIAAPLLVGARAEQQGSETKKNGQGRRGK